MELEASRLLPVDRESAWLALNDPQALKASIPGCDSIEKTGDNEYLVAMIASIGPVKAKFKGRLALSGIVAPERYTITFDGQGGAAGFGKGTAQVELVPEGAQTRLNYRVTAQVGGKIAQVGSRLVDGAARKLADDFFAAFSAELSRRHPGQAPAATPTPALVAPVIPAKSGIQFSRASIAWTLFLLALLVALWLALR